MGLNYPGEWKFKGVGFGISPAAVTDFLNLIKLTAKGTGKEKWVFETFKTAFGDSTNSSNSHFAVIDLEGTMRKTASDAASFTDSIWSGFEDVKHEVPVPDSDDINTILARHSVPLRIEPPDLTLSSGDIAVVDSDDDSAAGRNRELVYLRGDELGRGGFGAVYKVTRTTAIGDYAFAMKVHDPHVFNQNPEKAVERFKREMEVLKRLQHRAIIHHFEAGLDADRKPYILMPLIDGPNLRDSLSGQNLESVCHAFREVLSGIEYAHGRSVIHRDLKPQNILVRASDGQPIILDFGCAYLLDEADSKGLTTTLVGSVSYIPPEVLSDPQLRAATQDVFACGIMLYEVVAGAIPNRDSYEPLREIKSEFSPLDAIIRKAIAPVKTRIKSAADFLSELDGVA